MDQKIDKTGVPDTHIHIEMHKDSDISANIDIQELPQGLYPEGLREIPEPPKKLFYRGNVDLLTSDHTYICIIGSRKHTEYGRFVTREIIKMLRGQPVVIVSGLATGIDTIALETALEFDLPTIAVTGSGLHDSVIYPAQNIGLVYRMIKNNGLVLSEYDALFRAIKWSFPLRNRIMAGLSKAIIIIEGSSKSGTLITARLGLEYGRDIIAVPGPITSEVSQGPLSLLEAGAIPLTKPTDILRILGLESSEMLLHDQAARLEKYERCTPEEQSVLSALKEPSDRSQIMDETNFSTAKLQIILSVLEIKGLIFERNGKLMRM